jgi:hypothetical protein
MSNLMKTGPTGAEFFHADGRTGRHDDVNSRFSQCCERDWKHYVMSACLNEMIVTELINDPPIQQTSFQYHPDDHHRYTHVHAKQTHRVPFVFRCRMLKTCDLKFQPRDRPRRPAYFAVVSVQYCPTSNGEWLVMTNWKGFGWNRSWQ